jgi:hypothetical protein
MVPNAAGFGGRSGPPNDPYTEAPKPRPSDGLTEGQIAFRMIAIALLVLAVAIPTAMGWTPW